MNKRLLVMCLLIAMSVSFTACTKDTTGSSAETSVETSVGTSAGTSAESSSGAETDEANDPGNIKEGSADSVEVEAMEIEDEMNIEIEEGTTGAIG